MGAGVALGLVSCALAVPPTARMLFKCGCDMILILERAFRYQGKYVSIKQIEDAAVYYTTAMTTTFAGKELLLQKHVHDEIDRLIPLLKVTVSFKFSKLRPRLEDIIYKNRFLKTEPARGETNPTVPEIGGAEILELDASQTPGPAELPGQKTHPVELPAQVNTAPTSPQSQKEVFSSGTGSNSGTNTTVDDLLSLEMKSTSSQTLSDQGGSPVERRVTESIVSPMSPNSEALFEKSNKGNGMFSRGTRKLSSRLGLKKSKTVQE